MSHNVTLSIVKSILISRIMQHFLQVKCPQTNLIQKRKAIHTGSSVFEAAKRIAQVFEKQFGEVPPVNSFSQTALQWQENRTDFTVIQRFFPASPHRFVVLWQAQPQESKNRKFTKNV